MPPRPIEHDANLLCFAGGVLRSPHRFGAQRNAIYEIAGPENIDGLLILSGSLGNHVGLGELIRFCERFRPLPMCSIAVALPGVSSVLVDNATGMRDAIVHLLEAHGHRRIAFIRGPEANEEAERRYRVYRDVLAERGVPLDSQLVAVGEFQQESGKAAVDLLFGERGLCSRSDRRRERLRWRSARSKRWPRAACACRKTSRWSASTTSKKRVTASPPLTTVRQPLEQQGRRAAELLLSKIAGQPTPEQVVLHTELVTRGSCGCPRKVPRVEDLTSLEEAIRSQAEQRLNVQRWARALAETGEALLTTFDVGLLARVAAEQFPQLGIESCFLSLYRGDHPPFERSRLVLAWERRGEQPRPASVRAPLHRDSWLRPALCPSGAATRSWSSRCSSRPISSASRCSRWGPREGVIYEALRDQISGALKGALLVQQVVEKDRERQRLLRYIVDVTPDMHRVQPLEDLFGNILGQVTGLLGAVESAPAPQASGSIPPPPEAEGFLGDDRRGRRARRSRRARRASPARPDSRVASTRVAPSASPTRSAAGASRSTRCRRSCRCASARPRSA